LADHSGTFETIYCCIIHAAFLQAHAYRCAGINSYYTACVRARKETLSL